MVIEILFCKIKKGKLQKFLKVEKDRIKAMAKVDGCIERFVLKHPRANDVFLICTKWQSKEFALNYCGERLQRSRFQHFVDECLEGFEISFYESVF